MLFCVERTSVFDSEISPCDEAKQMDCLRIDERTFKSPEEHDEKLVGTGYGSTKPWLSEGMNHRKTKVGIARDFQAKAWFVEIEDLDALIAFTKKYGSVIVQSEYCTAKGYPYIEIYDDYRE